MDKKIFKYIKDYKNKNGYAPSQSSIAKKMKCSRQYINVRFAIMKEDLIELYPEYKRYFKG